MKYVVVWYYPNFERVGGGESLRVGHRKKRPRCEDTWKTKGGPQQLWNVVEDEFATHQKA